MYIKKSSFIEKNVDVLKNVHLYEHKYLCTCKKPSRIYKFSYISQGYVLKKCSLLKKIFTGL
jgi:hypothetical protein